MDKNYVMTVENLTYSYKGGITALDNLSFNIAAGEFVAIIGQNGAGKTTLVKHFNGLLRPTSGRVVVGGIDTAKAKVSAMARKVGFVFQNPDHQIFHEHVGLEIAFGPQNLGLPADEVERRVTDALEAVGLLEYREASPRNLSKGQRQRVALASVLAMKTDIIVLDEPTTGQDYKESLQIMDLAKGLNEQGHTILFITHDMNLVARYAQRAIVLYHGKVVMDDDVATVFENIDILNKTLLHPPQVVELAQKLKKEMNLNLPKGILSPGDLAAHLKMLREVE